MKKILSTLICFISFLISFSQTRELNTNGHLLKFKAIDTLFYSEYSNNGITKRNAIKEDFYSLNLKYNLGKISRKENKNSNEKPVFTSKYYVYTDGTLQSPTTQLFFKPKNLINFKKSFGKIGIIEEHKILKGYFYLNVTDNTYNTGESIFSLCETIYKSKTVNIVEPVFSKLIKLQNPLRPFQWNIKNNGNVTGAVVGADMQVENAWCSSTGTGIRVAVIDDGVDLNHPDLIANLLPGFDATGNNSNGAPTTNNAHGTNCAGIIASVNNTIGTIGVAYDAKIIPIRQGIVNVITGTYNTNETWQSNCFNEAVSRGADVISNSWGGGSPSAQMEAAIQNALTNGRGGKGCVILFSSGNRNGNISYPSSLGNVISVGASTPCDTRKRSSNNPSLVLAGVNTDPEGTSCDGEDVWGSNFGVGLDLLAPGVKISTTDLIGSNGYSFGDYFPDFNGTSAACPNAAAAVALILAANPNLTGAQARNILEQTCDKVGGYSYQANVGGQPNGTWTNQAGYGRINADRAVLLALGQVRDITGADLICNSGSIYIVNGIPCNSTVIWNVSASSGGTVTLTNYTGNPTSIIIPSNFPISASILLTANISGLATPITKTIFYGQPGFGASYKNGITDGNPVAIYFPNQPPYNFNNVCTGYGFPNVYVDAQPYGANNVIWSVPSGYATSAFSLQQQNGNRAYFNWNYGGSTPPGYLQASVTNGCGSFSQIFAFQQVNCGTPGGDPCGKAMEEKYFTVSPNPANDVIKIGIANRPPPVECKQLKALNSPRGISFSNVNIYNNLGVVVKSYRANETKQTIMQIGNLIAGNYMVEISTGDYTEKHQIIVQK